MADSGYKSVPECLFLGLTGFLCQEEALQRGVESLKVLRVSVPCALRICICHSLSRSRCDAEEGTSVFQTRRNLRVSFFGSRDERLGWRDGGWSKKHAARCYETGWVNTARWHHSCPGHSSIAWYPATCSSAFLLACADPSSQESPAKNIKTW